MAAGWLTWAGGPRVASAQSSRVDPASELVEAAIVAQSVGKYDFAIQALSQAHATSGRGALLYSLAEAHRRRHAIDKAPHDLSRAVELYRRYLQVVPGGAHQAEARRALGELEPVLEQMPVDEGSVDQAAAREALATRLSVTSPSLGAVVRVDGAAPRTLPLFVEIAPGKHRLVVEAPGYGRQVREIFVPAGHVYPTSVALDPTPAKLHLLAPSGARIHVDGKFVGVAPLAKALEVDPGHHFVAVTMNGFASRGQDVRVGRGETSTLRLDLAATSQRKLAWVFMGTGAAGVVGGVALGVASVIELRKAREIQQDADGSDLGEEQQRDHDAAVAARDDFRVGSGIAAGTGLGLFLVGGALFTFDNPPMPSQPGGRDRRGGRPPRLETSTSPVEVTALPQVGPGFTGSTIRVRF